MNIEDLRNSCLEFRSVTEDIKWGNNLVFSVAGKIFCLADLDPPLSVALKVPEEDFDELTTHSGISQAPHFARRQWISISEGNTLTDHEWQQLLKQSYDLVVAKLPKRERQELGR